MGQDAESSALYTHAKSNLGDRVLGELEKSSFIALPDRGEHSGLLPLKTVSLPGGFDEELNSSSSRVRVTRLGCVQGLHSSNMVSGSLLEELLWFL